MRTMRAVVLSITCACASAPGQSRTDAGQRSAWQPIATITTQPRDGDWEPDSLIFVNGTRFGTGLYDVKVLGLIPRRTKAPYLILQGIGCTECDGVPLIYIQSPADGPVRYPAQLAYAPPGAHYSPDDFDATVPVLRARVFIGHCLDSMTEGVLWLASERDSTSWKALARVAEVLADSLRTRELADPLPQTRDVVPFVKRGTCRELKPF